jgi:hypothetical protein
MSEMKIKVAAGATDRVVEEVMGAQELLAGSLMVNGFGVLSDPQDARRILRAAIERLTTACQIIEGVTWPNKVEYEAADQ